ncbi:MAG: cache domain-containing protein [Patescibacteria group bacterium]
MENFFFKKRLLLICVLLFFLLSIIILTAYQYHVATSHFDEMIKSRRETVSYLAASLIGERFNVLKELLTSYGLSRDLRSQVIQNNWDEAINIAREILKVHPDVERVSIFDPKGTFMAGFPVAAELTGQNFAYRDWYKEVIKTDNTYLSDIVKRKVKPTYNVINLSTPIKDFNNNLIGILTLQVRLSQITKWAKDFEFGNGFVYFVDRKGQVSGDPKYSELDETIPNFSNVPVVKKVLQGKQGVEVQGNQLVAYSPVKGYGWGVVTQESLTKAFKMRAEYIQITILFGFILMVSNAILVWLLLRKI